MMLRGLLALSVFVGCASPIELPLALDPRLAGGTAALIVERGSQRELVVQPVSEPFAGIDADPGALRLRMLVWPEPIARLGVLRLRPPDGAAAPRPSAAFEAELDAGAFRPLVDVDAALKLLALEAPDPCAALTVTRDRVPVDDDEFGVRAVLPVAPDRALLVLQFRLFVATATAITEIPSAVDAMRAADLAPDGSAWITTATGLWRGRWDGRGLGLSEVAAHGELRAPYALAAGEDELLELSRDGLLRRFHAGSWSVVHAFDTGGEAHARGGVFRVGPRAFAAGVATDRGFFRWENGEGELIRIDEADGSGAVGFARFGELGLVAGTNLGHLLVESRQFRELPDDAGAVPDGIHLRALAPLGDDLVLAGDLGWVGMLTSGGELCAAPEHGAATFRLAAPLGEGLLLAGQSLPGATREIVVSRVGRQAAR